MLFFQTDCVIGLKISSCNIGCLPVATHSGKQPPEMDFV